MTLVLEDYRGFDISDKIRAVKLDSENMEHFFKVLVEGQAQVTLTGGHLGVKQMTWTAGNVRHVASEGDYIIKDPADGFLAMTKALFEKNFARDI